MKPFCKNQSVYFFLFIFLYNTNTAIAQTDFHISGQVGQIIKHRNILHFDTPPLSIGGSIDVSWQTRGSEYWHRPHHYPRLGVAALYYNLGSDVLGEAVAVAPFLDYSLFRSVHYNGYIQFAYGIGYLTRHYDEFTNPTNNAIGSAVNGTMRLKLMIEKKRKGKTDALIGFSLTHFSNGGSQLPNYGINIPAIDLGLRFGKKVDVIKNKAAESLKPAKKWGGIIHTDLAMVESQTSRGPRYPIYTASTAISYQYRKTNRFFVGFTAEENRAAATFGQHVQAFNSTTEARKAARRYAPFVGYEALFGNTALVYQTGYYLTDAYLLPHSFYFKFGLRYYAPPIGKPKTRFFGQVLLKTHLAVAEYISIGGGASF